VKDQRNDVTIIEGKASFVDTQTIKVASSDNPSSLYSTDHFVIATGPHLYHPNDIDFDNRHALDSDTVLQMKKLPATLTV